MMRGGGGSKIGKIGPGNKFAYTMGLCGLIMVAAVVIWLP
jgi:hypothetical protein